jgi:hypothetical protein
MLTIDIMEVIMHGTFDRPGQSHNRVDRSFRLVAFLLPALLTTATIALAVARPAASLWISQAAQAEFVGVDLPDRAPTQIAQPTMASPSVSAN